MTDTTWDTIFVDGSPRIALDVMGEGPLVVFLHGIGGNKLNWHQQLPAFAGEFTAAAWDARGYGQSEDYDGDLDFSDFSHDLARVLDHFGAAKAHLCGLSMGGRVAQDFYALYPERVATLVLCDTFAGDDSGDTRSGRSQTIEEFVESRIRPFLDGADPAELARQRGGRLMAPDASADARQRAIDAASQLHVDSYIKTVRASAAFSRVENLKNIDVPTLLVFGEVDPLTPPHVGEYMRERIKGSVLEIIEKAGHMTNLEKPDAFNDVVLPFLRTHRGLAG
ncbi:MAG: alpha/beta hydrolase [Rhodospirillaceae bacterium]|jgi:3-oxoadipate enol-lactonase|nr:alpha/beta hydrolase [Rhodospirillaceae bacterium]MBT5459171.1 alpha/beta hydrolase [Rhodospirillaceae bacterium]MBT5895546.1 alpha/beta hydrolase [Rhodospirillaceae bacterium]